jgi:hypothetical protein
MELVKSQILGKRTQLNFVFIVEYMIIIFTERSMSDKMVGGGAIKLMNGYKNLVCPHYIYVKYIGLLSSIIYLKQLRK